MIQKRIKMTGGADSRWGRLNKTQVLGGSPTSSNMYVLGTSARHWLLLAL